MLSSILEQGWENEPRIVKKSGKYTIRESMALAEVSDVVVGAETGMLNSVAHRSMPKIVLLSHSSANNLTKHWVNTAAIEPHKLNVNLLQLQKEAAIKHYPALSEASGGMVAQTEATLVITEDGCVVTTKPSVA